jgi:hypothetical protein
MASLNSRSGDWQENERAFHAAVSELHGPAAALGLVLAEPHYPVDGWRCVLHAELRRNGSQRVLSCIDVGLNASGEMLVQTLPGEVRKLSSFEARDKAFYLRKFRRLVGVALVSD